ncbi:MAG: hypothetical protein NWE96_08255 [Candidatus Bathyarchaeota archaeon]|nr:hypothetical protein [Candidatus Bathyarchaeota archaeon]
MGNRLWSTNNHPNQPIEVFSKLHQHYQTTYRLESIQGPQKLAQYSCFSGFPATTAARKQQPN